MIALITLVIPPGGDAGPFNLYSNTDGYTTPFATNISAAALTAGYTSTVVPNGTTIIRVVSTGVCTNYIDITINLNARSNVSLRNIDAPSKTSKLDEVVPSTNISCAPSESTINLN